MREVRLARWAGRNGGELLARKILDLCADYGDAALVRGVELEDARAVEVWTEELFREGEDRAGLAGARGAVEEEMWEVGLSERALEEVGCVFLRGDVGEGFGTAV